MEETASWKILMVDDDEDDYFLVRSMLAETRRAKSKVDWAPSFETGRQAIQANTYDVVLMDYNLGAKNGLQLIREAIAAGFPAPFILFTGHGSLEIDQESMRAGATLYLIKGETSPLLLERSIRYAIERRQIELALEQKTLELEHALGQAEFNQSMLKAIMDYIPEGITIASSKDLKISMVSRYGQQLLGKPHDQKTIDEVVGEWMVLSEDGKRPLESDELPLTRAIYKGEIVRDQELVQINTDGQRLNLSCNAGPIYNSSGEIVGGVVAWRDAGERKRREDDLRASEQKYSLLFDKAGVAASLTRLPENTFVDVNVAFERLFGFNRGEVIGKTALELGIALPEEQAATIFVILHHGEQFGAEKHVYTKSGEERIILLHVGAFEMEGETYAISTLQDITQRKRMEEALRQEIAERQRVEAALRTSEASFREVLDNSRDVIYSLNLSTGRYHYISPSVETVLGYTADELMAQDFTTAQKMLHPDDLSKVIAGLTQAAEKGKGELEYRQRTKSGEYLWISNHFTIIKDNAGRPVFRNGSISDMSSRKLAEERLQFQANLLANISEVVYSTDPQLHITSWNHAAEQMYGWREEEVLGKNLLDVVQSQSYSRIQPQLVTELEQKGTVTAELEHSTKAGQVVTFETTFMLLHDSKDEVSGILSVNHDITGRKEREKRLNQLNRTLTALTHSSQAMLHAVDEQKYLDEICRIVVQECGHAMVWIGFAEDDKAKTVRPAAFAGFDEGYIQGLNITWADNEHGQGPTGTAIRTGRAKICRNILTDPAFQTWKDQAIQRGFASSVAFPLMAGGKPFGAISIYSRDPDPFSVEELNLLAELTGDMAYGITTLRLRNANEQAAIALAQSELTLRSAMERYQSLFEGMTEGFALHEVILDAAGKVCDYRFIDLNPAFERLTGLKRNDVVGRTFREVLPDDDPSWIKIYGDVALTGIPAQFENYSPVLKKYYEVFCYRPAPNQFAVIFLDITIRKQAEAEVEKYTAQLRRSNEELEQFASIASHDLQEPLRKIRGFGDLLTRSLGDTLPEEASDYLVRMQSAAVRMEKMISDLLELSRVNTHGGKFSHVSLNQLAEEAISNLESRLNEIQGTTMVGPLPEIEADPTQIVRLLQNLIGNAIKYHQEGEPPIIKISAEVVDAEEGQCVILKVADNGIGFDEKHLNLIFQPFTRLHGRGEYEGTGIGLAVCKKIIQRHHGSITAHSQPGKGSTFIATLPVSQKN